jgi:hypothetical protein
LGNCFTTFLVYCGNNFITFISSSPPGAPRSGAHIISCEGVDELPRVMLFDNLHCTDSLREAKTALKETSGIYCIANQETGQMYIGPSVDLHGRLMDHLIYYNYYNTYLQRAIAKYGLAAFIFLVVEQCTKESLLEREQYWLNWLFSLPDHLRYYFSPTAGSLLGFKHSDETKSQISASIKGRSVSEDTRILLGARLIYVFDAHTKVLISQFLGEREASRNLCISRRQIRKSLSSGLSFKGFLFSYSSTI